MNPKAHEGKGRNPVTKDEPENDVSFRKTAEKIEVKVPVDQKEKAKKVWVRLNPIIQSALNEAGLDVADVLADTRLRKFIIRLETEGFQRRRDRIKGRYHIPKGPFLGVGTRSVVDVPPLVRERINAIVALKNKPAA